MADPGHYPRSVIPEGGIEPAPRRLRGVLGGETIFDTTAALYHWDKPYYPRYCVPLEDVEEAALEGLGEAATVHGEDAEPGLAGTVSFEWKALDAWFEEDEEVFVHARNPYARVDALRSSRAVRVELEGAVLADSGATVMVFETGLPPRRYFERTAVNFEHLEASETVTECPYKGTTSDYWSARINGSEHPDIAWSYDFPTRQLLPITGLVAFFDEHVDLFVDGEPVASPETKFSAGPNA